MFAIPTPQQLALLHDEELMRLAGLWRAQALRGIRPAFGVAHALEVECRRRACESKSPAWQAPPDAPAEASRLPWWKSWWAKAATVTALGAPVVVRYAHGKR